MNKVRTAIIGCGMVSNIYIRNLKHLFSITDLVAVCDMNPASAAEKAATYGIDRVMTVDEIAADKGIELVVNLTPPFAHYDIIKRMLLAGKHIYTEKLFTTSLEKTRELVALADELGLMIAVSPDTVLGAGIQTARKLIDSGLVGKITSGFVSLTRNQNLNSETYRFLQKDGGTLPYDVGIYYIAALIALLGPVKAVRAFGAPALKHEKELLYDDFNADSWTIPGINLVVAGLEFESGVLVSVHFNGNAVGEERHSIELYGTEATLTLGDPNNFNGPVTMIRPEAAGVQIPFTHGYDGVNRIFKPFEYDHMGHRGIGAAELAYAIRGNRPNRLSKEYGLHCQEILYGINEASRTGETYTLSSTCSVRPLASGYYGTSFGGEHRADSERSLVD